MKSRCCKPMTKYLIFGNHARLCRPHVAWTAPSTSSEFLISSSQDSKYTKIVCTVGGRQRLKNTVAVCRRLTRYVNQRSAARRSVELTFLHGKLERLQRDV